MEWSVGFTDRTFDDIVRVRHHYTVVDLVRVRFSVQILMQPVAEHPYPLRGLLVYLKVVGEAEGCRAAGQQALCD